MKVSVIIPYDRDRGYLKRAIKSVKDQTYEDIELILSEGPGNCAVNFNNGVRKAKGELIRKLDSDDYLPLDSIEKSVAGMKDYDFTHGNAYILSKDKIVPYISPCKHPTARDLFESSTLHEITVMYRADVFDRFGLFDDSIEQAQTYEFHLRILSKGAKIGYINEYLVYYRRHNDQLSYGSAKDVRGKVLAKIKNRYANVS